MLLKKNVLSARWAAGALSLASLLLLPGAALADSAFAHPTPGHTAEDTYLGRTWISFAMGPGGTSMLGWDDGSDSLLLIDENGDITNFGGPSSEDYPGTIYNGFVNFNANYTRALVGFTTGGNVDDRIYEVDLTSPLSAWEQVAGFAGNGDALYRGDSILVAGANGPFGTPHGLWLMSDTGVLSHQILETGGFAAGIAQDAAGGVYMLTYFIDSFDPFDTSGQLLYINPSQMAAAMLGQELALENISVIADLDHGGGSVDVGPDGLVLYSANSELWVYDPGDGSFQLVANTTGFDSFFTVDAEANGWFVGAYGQNRIAVLNPVPEPGSAFLLALAGGGLSLIRRRRRLA